MSVTRKATIHDLPLELLEVVIQQNRFDLEAVLSSSLVCHKWRIASLETLFHSVPLSHDDQFRQFLETTQRYPALLTRCIRKVKFAPGSRFKGSDSTFSRRLVAKPPPSLRGCTGCVAQFEVPNHKWFLRDLSHDPPIDLIPLPAMRSVRSLNWYAPSDESTQNNAAVASFLECFPALVQLTLHARFMNVEQVKIFLYFCGSSLQELTLESVRIEDYENILDAPLSASCVPQLSGLKTLRIGTILLERGDEEDEEDEEEDWLVREILSPHPPTDLQKIWLSGNSYITPDAFGHLLNMCLHSLNDLTIAVHHWPLWEKSELADIFSNKAFPKLSKMEFATISFDYDADDGFRVLDWYRHLIKTLPENFAPNLHSLSLRFRFLGKDYADFVHGWNALKSPERYNFNWHAFVLEDISTKFPALQELSLSFYVFYDTKMTEAEKEELPQVVLDVFPNELKFIIISYWQFEL